MTRRAKHNQRRDSLIQAAVRRVIASQQFFQWRQLGLAEVVSSEDGAIHWRWTEKGTQYSSCPTRTMLGHFVAGIPLYPIEADRIAVEKQLREGWAKDGFDADGFPIT